MTDSPVRRPSEDQSEAIRFASGPCQIIAGPGSGKTFVLVEHIVYLIETLHISPSSILVLTFSKAAALEMQKRFRERTDSSYPDVLFGTFHSVFYHILRLSSSEPIRVADQASCLEYLRQCINEYYAKEGAKPTPDMLSSEISRYKSAAGRSYSAPLSFPYPEHLPSIIRDYNRFLKENGMVDYDDMITDCLSLFKKDKRALGIWQERFAHILVDEFQDVNPGQYSVLRLLAGGKACLYTVGDDDQSIYGFRGSNPACMKWFRTDFPGCRTIFLSINYRSGRTIVNAASRVIRENRLRFPKKIRSGRDDAGAFSMKECGTRAEEYAYIVKELLAMTQEERAQSAVIFRGHGQAKSFRRVLDKMRGSSLSLDREPLYRMVLEDLAAYFRFAGRIRKGQGAREDLYRIMNRPMRYLSRESFKSEMLSADQLYVGAGKNTIPSKRMVRFLEDLQVLGTVRPAIGIRYLFDTMEYRSWTLNQYSGKDREKLTAAFLKIGKDISSLSSPDRILPFLEERLKALPQEPPEKDSEFAIITMHASKGLEFSTVFIPDVNEGVIPSAKSQSEEMIEEERRLFYVAMTRAKEKLVLTYAKESDDMPQNPSRFLLPFGIRSRKQSRP